MNKLSPERRATASPASWMEPRSGQRRGSRASRKEQSSACWKSAGTVCASYQDAVLRNLPCRRIQADEIWSFVLGRDRNITPEVRDHAPSQVGSVWTWTAIDADSKLMVSWYVGSRDAFCAGEFVKDLASRLSRRIQLTTDGLKLYVNAVEEAFGGEIDYAMLTKLYGPSGNDKSPEVRYSPGRIAAAETTYMSGVCNEMHISTSYVERQNLTIRMSMRRFTRLTNGFSKKFENHCRAISLHMFHYNFIRPHQTLGQTPAMEIGIADRRYTLLDIVDLIDSAESEAAQVREA